MAAATQDMDEGQNFWPGYVDTLVNMVMFLILLIVILSMAVMFFSIKARNDALKSAVPLKDPSKMANTQVYPGVADELPANPTMEDMRHLIDRLRMKLNQSELRFKSSGLSPIAKPDQKEKGNVLKSDPEPNLNKEGKSDQVVGANTENNLGKKSDGVEAFSLRPSVLIVRFKPSTLDLSPQEAQRMAEIFTKHFDWSANNKDQQFEISASAAEGLSESNRMAFYRVVSVRNQIMSLIGMPGSRIRSRIVPVPAGQASGLEALEVRITKLD